MGARRDQERHLAWRAQGGHHPAWTHQQEVAQELVRETQVWQGALQELSSAAWGWTWGTCQTNKGIQLQQQLWDPSATKAAFSVLSLASYHFTHHPLAFKGHTRPQVAFKATSAPSNSRV